MSLPRLQIPEMTYLRQLSADIPIILGSGSPRRRDLLQQAGIPFRIMIANVPEIVRDNEAPDEAARRLASLKASHVAQILHNSQTSQTESPTLIIAADTIVWSQSVCLGKPADANEAFGMLQSLRGQTHKVFTGVAMQLRRNSVAPVRLADVAETAVTFNNVSDRELRRYIATGDPSDKAGAYGAQQLGAFLVDRLDGELDTVIGFPLALVDDLAGAILEHINAS